MKKDTLGGNRMKAVLVIDEMPKECYLCQFAYCDNRVTYQTEEWFCTALSDTNITSVANADKSEKQIKDNCPLRPLPQREKANEGSYGVIGMVDTAWTQGFNDCLAEITGETE